MPKLPFIKFFPNDWMADPALRMCSVAARGLWMDMLSLMHLSPRRGYLLAASGSPLTPEQLARLTGCSADEVTRLLAELHSSGTCSCTDDGIIYSRRMVRDEGKREKCADAGRKGGGNPALGGRAPATFKGAPKGGAKGRSKGEPKPPEARGQTPEPPLPPGVGGGGGEDGEDRPPPGPAPPRAGPTPAEVVAHWNSFPGLTPVRSTDAHRERLIRQWATGDPQWAAHWRAVIAFVGRTPFYHGENPSRWRVTLKWLFERSNFADLLDKALADGPRPARPGGVPLDVARRLSDDSSGGEHPLLAARRKRNQEGPSDASADAG